MGSLPGSCAGRAARLARASLLLALIGPATVCAQQPAPGRVLPAPIERARQTPPPARAEPPERRREGVAPIPPAQPGEVTFRLEGIALMGVSSDAPADLLQEAAPLLYKQVGLSQLKVLAANIARRYHDAGYLLAHAFVPVQTVRDGVVRIEVREGRFASCRFEGQPVSSDSPLQRYADKLCSIRPMRLETLERYLLLMNDVPGVEARAIIVPAAVEGADPDLLVQLRQHHGNASLAVSNRETEALGTWRGEARGELYDAFGWDGRHWAYYRHTAHNGLNLLSLGQELPLGSEGTKWGLSALGSRSAASLFDAQLALDSELATVDAGVSYPWIRRRTHNLFVRGTFSALNSRTELEGLPFIDDRIRSLRAGLTFDAVDRARGTNVLDLEISHGIDGLGATPTGSPDASRTGGRSDYTKLNLYVARLQSLRPRLALLAAAQGQYTDQPLLAPEQFALGGEQWLRAYDAAELLGDRGFGAKLELRYGPVASGAANLYAFYDYGRVYYNDSSLPSQSAASAGGGIRFTLRNRLGAYLEVAVPIGRDVASQGNRDPRVFGGIQFAF